MKSETSRTIDQILGPARCCTILLKDKRTRWSILITGRGEVQRWVLAVEGALRIFCAIPNRQEAAGSEDLAWHRKTPSRFEQSQRGSRATLVFVVVKSKSTCTWCDGVLYTKAIVSSHWNTRGDLAVGAIRCPHPTP